MSAFALNARWRGAQQPEPLRLLRSSFSLVRPRFRDCSKKLSVTGPNVENTVPKSQALRAELRPPDTTP